MIPTLIRSYLDKQHAGYSHHVHAAAMTAQELAANEHVTGRIVAKPVVIRLDGKLAFAVVAATDKVNLAMLEEATGAKAELVPEREFSTRFSPCEVGAEPPLALFGLPIFFDEKLERLETLVMPGGTHEDAIELATGGWMRSERAQPVANLGRPVS
jgi:Ala-tRNA(Pro) deacylase